MQSPSVRTGETAVLNLGHAEVKSLVKSFRQMTLPVAASRQETDAPSSSVTTLPSVTAGELRGP
jgi:hypothetical protein